MKLSEERGKGESIKRDDDEGGAGGIYFHS